MPAAKAKARPGPKRGAARSKAVRAAFEIPTPSFAKSPMAYKMVEDAERKRKAYAQRKQLRPSASLMSPFNKVYPPFNNNSLGNFTTLNLISRATFSTSTTDALILMYNPSARGIFQTAIWNATTGAVVVGSVSSQAMGPTWRFATADAPLSIRPMRAGLRLHNYTANQDLAGVVRILQQSSPVTFTGNWGASGAITVGLASDLYTGISDNAKSREMTGAELSTNKHEWIIAPATASQYNSYGLPFEEVNNWSNFNTQFEAQENDMAMNHLFMVFEPTPTSQTYSVTFGLQAAGRYPTTSILQELAKPHFKAKDPSTIDNMHEAVQRLGSDPYPPFT